MKNYCSVKIGLKILTGCSRFKSTLINPSFKDLKLKVYKKFDKVTLEIGQKWYLYLGGKDMWVELLGSGISVGCNEVGEDSVLSH